jgi:DNA-binding XRE family transcriptional regulator
VLNWIPRAPDGTCPPRTMRNCLAIWVMGQIHDQLSPFGLARHRQIHRYQYQHTWTSGPAASSVLAVSAPARPDQALASALRRLREERQQTQEDIAHDAGITVAALARIERGQTNPRWTTIRSIASALNVGLGELGEAVEQSR